MVFLVDTGTSSSLQCLTDPSFHSIFFVCLCPRGCVHVLLPISLRTRVYFHFFAGGAEHRTQHGCDVRQSFFLAGDDRCLWEQMVVWVALSPLQRKVYAKYLGGESVKDILSGQVSSPLGAISHLKKVRVFSRLGLFCYFFFRFTSCLPSVLSAVPISFHAYRSR